MPTLMYTTGISAHKTAGEILDLLARHNASAVAVRYEKQRPVGVSFTLLMPFGAQHFDMPVRTEQVYRLLREQYDSGKISRRYCDRDQAERTAWRVVKTWLQAQLAMVEADLVTLPEVMLPYLRVDDGRTLYDRWHDAGLRELTQ